MESLERLDIFAALCQKYAEKVKSIHRYKEKKVKVYIYIYIDVKVSNSLKKDAKVFKIV